jgi:hypothetical protein
MYDDLRAMKHVLEVGENAPYDAGIFEGERRAAYSVVETQERSLQATQLLVRQKRCPSGDGYGRSDSFAKGP